MRGHQEEIKGPSDSLDSAPTISQIRRHERCRKPSQKALENQQSLPAPAAAAASRKNSNKKSIPTAKSPEKSPAPAPNNTPVPLSGTDVSKSAPKEKWEQQFRRVRGRNARQRKFKILKDHLPPNEPFPKALNLPQYDSWTLLPADVNDGDPLSLFYLFFTLEMLETLAWNTNLEAQRRRHEEFTDKCPHPRPWVDVTGPDIGAYIGALLLIGCHPSPLSVDSYWNTNEDSPFHPLAKYCSQKRFEQISRYFKINNPTLDDEDPGWTSKFEPLAAQLRIAFARYFRAGSLLSIDEELILCQGRSKHTISMNSKRAGTGYKIYSLCGDAYLIDFLFSSAEERVTDLQTFKQDYEEEPSYSESESVILTLVDRQLKRFPRRTFTVVIDNFFTTTKLLQKLRRWQIGAFGTCKSGSGFPKDLVYWRECTSKEKNYGEWANAVIADREVNCLVVVDSVATFMMSTIHDVATEWDTSTIWRSAKKRPGASQTLAKEDADGITLPYHQVQKDYNNSMNGSDLQAQLRAYYTTQQGCHLRVWWPIFWFLLDSVIVNAYTIFKLRGHKGTHHAFQLEIAHALLRNPAARLRRRAWPIKIHGANPTAIKKEEDHTLQKIGARKRKWCKECASTPTTHAGPGRGKTVLRPALQEVSGNARRGQQRKKTGWECRVCKTGCCQEEACIKSHTKKMA